MIVLHHSDILISCYEIFLLIFLVRTTWDANTSKIEAISESVKDDEGYDVQVFFPFLSYSFFSPIIHLFLCEFISFLVCLLGD